MRVSIKKIPIRALEFLFESFTSEKSAVTLVGSAKAAVVAAYK